MSVGKTYSGVHISPSGYAYEPYNGDGYYEGCRVRPVVCLPSNILGSTDALGRWKLE